MACSEQGIRAAQWKAVDSMYIKVRLDIHVSVKVQDCISTEGSMPHSVSLWVSNVMV